FGLLDDFFDAERRRQSFISVLERKSPRFTIGTSRPMSGELPKAAEKPFLSSKQLSRPVFIRSGLQLLRQQRTRLQLRLGAALDDVESCRIGATGPIEDNAVTGGNLHDPEKG